MEEDIIQRLKKEPQEEGSAALLSGGKKPWQEPKLTFVEPKLTQHGKLEEVTGFFGGFSPH
jgi:hypothetical protein